VNPLSAERPRSFHQAIALHDLINMPSERDQPSDHYKLHLALSIYAQENLKPVTRQRHALMEAVNRQFSHAPIIEREIAEIQRRLGTPCERPDDMDRAKTAAHQLANMLCTALLLGNF